MALSKCTYVCGVHENEGYYSSHPQSISFRSAFTPIWLKILFYSFGLIQISLLIIRFSSFYNNTFSIHTIQAQSAIPYIQTYTLLYFFIKKFKRFMCLSIRKYLYYLNFLSFFAAFFSFILSMLSSFNS